MAEASPSAPEAAAESLRDLAETLPHIVWVANADGTVTYYNGRWTEYSGAPTSTGHGWGWTPVVHPDDVDATTAAWRHSLATGEPYDIEHRIRRHDGEFRWFASRARPQRDASGQVVRWYGTATDVHDQKRAERQATLRAEQQAAIAKIGQTALEDRPLDEILWAINQLLHDALGVTHSKILELQADRETLLLRTGFGWRDGLVGRASVGTDLESQAGYTLLSDMPVIVRDLQVETRFSGPTLLLEHGIRSGVSVIIPSESAPYGVLGVHCDSLRTFTEDDAHFLVAVANVISEVARRHKGEAYREALVQALAVERRRLHDIFLQVPAFIATIREPNQVFEIANELYFQLIGRRDIIGRSVRDALPELEDQGFFELVDRVIESGEPFRGMDVPIVLQRLDGSTDTRYVDFVYLPLRDADGSVAGMLAHGVDVTEKVEARTRVERLAEEANRNLSQLEAVVESMTDGMLIVTPEGRPSRANVRALEFLGYETFEALPGTLEELFDDFELFELDGRSLERERWPLARALAGERVTMVEYRVRRPEQGWERTFVFNASPVRDEGGNLILALLSFHDVTLLKDAERAQRALELERGITKRLDAERRRIGRDLHDGIRQQLVGTQMLSQNLQKRLEKRGIPEARLMQEFTDLVRDVNTELRGLLNELAPAHVTSEHLLPALQRAARQVEQWYGISCSVTADLEEPAVTDGVANHLFHIAQEAMTNAAKHAQPTEIRVTLDGRNGNVTLQVVDDGQGLPHGFESAGGMGVASMQQRSELIDANFSIKAASQAGTIVTCTLSAR